MPINSFKLLGAIGLVLISIGLLLKNRKHQDTLYILGGACLEIYSLYIQDTVFIILQIFFTISAIYDLTKLNSKNELR